MGFVRRRPSWDETWMNVAHDIAQRSVCSRARVGAVIVDEHNVIVATGYNGPPAGWRPPAQIDELPIDYFENCAHWCPRAIGGPTRESLFSYSDCPSLHAEENALSFCDRRLRLEGTIYVTSPVCIKCAKLVANSGLARVVVLEDTTRDYRVGDGVDGLEFIRTSGLIVDVVKDA